MLPTALAARCLAAVVGLSRPVAATAVVGTLAVAWMAIHAAGGAAVVVPHGYYVPVLLAAIRFGRWRALLVSVVAGILAGPLTYQVVATGQPQDVSEWLTRAAFFVLLGQLVAWLFSHALASVQADARLAQDDRELRRAIVAGQLSLRYQPIVRTADGRLVAAEALVRWDHPDGERGPASFLPTAERTGRIHQIGALVLRQACEQGVRWRDLAATVGVDPPVVSVNLSTQELADPGVVTRVHEVLESTGLPGRLLCLEVTESSLARDIDGSADRLLRLRALGVRIAIDDFGTGYSSLSYVHRFPLDVLKIDRSFVPEAEAARRARLFVSGIVHLCAQLGVRALVEGIETEAQLRLVDELGCDLAQGFHIARPGPAEVVDAWLVGASTGAVDREPSALVATARRTPPR